MKLYLLLCIPLLMVVVGCDELNPSSKKPGSKAQATKESRVPVHRFVLTRYDAGAAFDTQTGQLCRTWDWTVVGKPTRSDESGIVPQRSVGELTPTCLSLYARYPSGVNTQSEALSDEQP